MDGEGGLHHVGIQGSGPDSVDDLPAGVLHLQLLFYRKCRHGEYLKLVDCFNRSIYIQIIILNVSKSSPSIASFPASSF